MGGNFTNTKGDYKMKMKRNSKHTLSLFLCMVLVVAMTLFTTGCNGNTNQGEQGESQSQTKAESPTTQESVTDSTGMEEIAEENVDSTGVDETSTEATVFGEGEKQFAFLVVDGEGNETAFEIHTDKETVGEALLDLELIEGEEGAYGLYVKTVNGITVDYDKDKAYWAFYVNGEYAVSGVDTTAITEGDSYSFKVEK